jgi:hypothetical protein
VVRLLSEWGCGANLWMVLVAGKGPWVMGLWENPELNEKM